MIKFVFQYGVSADVYSLSIIIFELFSGMDPFPGNLCQIIESKKEDRKPEIPQNFPSDLKNVILCGWSKEPKKRASIEEFNSALNKVLIVKEAQADETDCSLNLAEKICSLKREEQHSPQDTLKPGELQNAENSKETTTISKEESNTNSEKGEQIYESLLFKLAILLSLFSNLKFLLLGAPV